MEEARDGGGWERGGGVGGGGWEGGGSGGGWGGLPGVSVC